MGKYIEIMRLPDFEAMLNAGNYTYTGLVEGIGYVYWKKEVLYFIRTNPQDVWGTPKYKQIPFPCFQKKDAEIVSKILHTLHVLPKEELRKQNFDAYYAFYGAIDEMMKLVHQRDATRVNRPLPLFPVIKNGVTGGNSRQSGLLSLGSQVNNQIGPPLEMMNMLIGNKRLGQIGDGLSLISIVDNIDKGEYWSAAGDVLLFAAGKTRLSPYLTAINFASWMYHTDLMQTRLATGFAKEYKNIQREIYNEEHSKRPDYNKIRRLAEKQVRVKKNFEDCMEKLGIKYNKSIQPQWKQGY